MSPAPVRSALITTALLAFLAAPATTQQRLLQPMPSPRAGVCQRIGVSQVEVDYSRPGVKGRSVMQDGNIVPMDSPRQPWRAGADENTVVSFEHDVTVEGKPLAAGSYGLHMFPSSQGPWTVAFSHDTHAWGSYSYDAAHDALRVEVTPQQGAFTEWLQYEFRDLTSESATLVLRWETTEVPMHLGVDTQAVMVDYLRNDYVRGYGFWEPAQLIAAATWCDTHDVNTEEALFWATRACNAAPSFAGLQAKASLERKLGRQEAADASAAAAERLATEPERNALGYQLLQAGELAQAIEVFAANAQQFPDSWNAHDSLAEACALSGDTASARQHYERALQLVTDASQQRRIRGALEKLGG